MNLRTKSYQIDQNAVSQFSLHAAGTTQESIGLVGLNLVPEENPWNQGIPDATDSEREAATYIVAEFAESICLIASALKEAELLIDPQAPLDLPAIGQPLLPDVD